MPVGRPTLYTPELGQRICQELAKPRSLLQICNEEWAPVRSTVYLWIEAHKDFSDSYERARGHQCEGYADEQITIGEQDARLVSTQWDREVDKGWVQLQKLRIEARRWAFERMDQGRSKAANGAQAETITMQFLPKPDK